MAVRGGRSWVKVSLAKNRSNAPLNDIQTAVTTRILRFIFSFPSRYTVLALAGVTVFFKRVPQGGFSNESDFHYHRGATPVQRLHKLIAKLRTSRSVVSSRTLNSRGYVAP